MREILFRAKNEDNGKWHYGDLRHYDEGTTIIAQCAGEYAFIDPDTVGQYTGLTDKNGEKIFEGDIIECWSEGVKARGAVQQRKDGQWIIYPAWQKTVMWGLCPDEYSHTTVEIIGNIHDNPELVGGAKKDD